MKPNKTLTNSEILEQLIKQSGCENDNQFAAYLTDKYGKTISRQNINQFKNSSSITITSMLLREALE